MNLPKGWPTKEMVEAAIDNLPNVNKEDVVFSLKAALSAAPTPPAQDVVEHLCDTNSVVEHKTENMSDKAQEDKPVAWRYKTVRGFWRYVGNRPRPYPYMPPEMLFPEPLYTRPANDNLRKAAEGAANALAGFCDDERWKGTWQRERLDNLRTALEGES